MKEKDYIEKLTDPKKVGPGIWFAIHTRALAARDARTKQDWAAMVRDIASHLKCDDCRGHAIQYVSENPPENYFGVKDAKTGADLGCFKWSWIFHNSVNKRIGKKELDFETALNMFANAETCTTCGTGDGHVGPGPGPVGPKHIKTVKLVPKEKR